MENQKKESMGEYVYRTTAVKIGRLLNEERKTRGLTIEQVAELVGLRSKYVKNAEFGGRKFNWVTVGILLRFYHKQLLFSLADWDEDVRGLMLTRAEYVRHKTEA